MNLAGATLAVLALAFAGVGDEQRTLKVGDRERSYLVHRPKAYDGAKRRPLVLAFHGGGGRARGMATLTHFDDIADERGFIVVYPEGVNHRWADGRGTTAPDRTGVDDVAFVAALLDRLEGDLAIDPARIYATGMSNGGFMAERLGCLLSGRIAAIAPVAATMGEPLAARCKPQRPLPVMLIHGTDDLLVPWVGGRMRFGAGGNILSVPATVALWTRLDGCSAKPATSELPAVAADATRVRRTVHGGCRDGAEVVLYTVQGGGHAWPGGLPYLSGGLVGKTSRAFDAGEVIWEFFARHPRP